MTTEERGILVKQIFVEASELAGEDRDRFLAGRCAGDKSLRATVDQLLNADDRVSSRFLNGSPMPVRQAGIPVRIAGFRILRKIGEGGMGSVFEAEQDRPRRRVAVKVIRVALGSESLLRRFRREVELLGRLKHPGIAQIFEAGIYQSDSGATPYFAMEFVAGRSLTEFVNEQGLDSRARLAIMACICDAAHHAHENGVIHRDLKPANILVEYADGGSRPKIVDFGVARAISSDADSCTLQTDAGQLLGTLSYMSPEQAGGRPQDLDARSDVYALGVILYEMLARQLPYEVNTASWSTARSAIQEHEPTRLGLVDSAFRGDIETIVAKALAKEKERRYSSAAAMAQDLRRFLRDEPIEARRASRTHQLRRFARRNRVLVGGVLATFLALALGIVGTGVALVRAWDAERSAQERLREAQQSAAQAAAVVAFVQEMLASADPARSLGEEVTIRGALDEAGSRIASGVFVTEPAVEAALRSTIGATYQSLGRFNEAEAHLTVALDIQRRIRPPDHVEVGNSMQALGLLMSVQGRQSAAVPLLVESLQILRRVHGARNADVASAMQSLAAALRGQGKLAEAEPYYRLALAIRLEVFGESHVDVAQSLNSIALLEQNKGDLDQAESLFRQALAMRRELFSDSHPVVADSLNNLANLLSIRGEHEETEALLREALAMRRKLLPAPHPAIGQSLYNLGLHLFTQNRLADAEPFFRQALAEWRLSLPEKHADVGTAAYMLGLTLGKIGAFAESESMIREALLIRESNMPDGHWLRYDAMIALAFPLAQQGKYQEAETLLLAGYEGVKDSTGAPTALKAVVIQRLVQLYEAWGLPEYAAEWRERLSLPAP